MKKLNRPVAACITTLAVLSLFPVAGQAQDASQTLYKAKCVACHGADGSGSATGKKLGAHDFQSVEVQRMPDADLSAAIANGKNKMPAYAKSLKPEEIKGLVAYIRSFKK